MYTIHNESSIPYGIGRNDTYGRNRNAEYGTLCVNKYIFGHKYFIAPAVSVHLSYALCVCALFSFGHTYIDVTTHDEKEK